MLDSRYIPASGEGTPVQVRDGPAAVRGDALPPRRHWVADPGRRRGREPRVRRPAARRQPEPLAEGGFVHRPTIAVVAVDNQSNYPKRAPRTSLSGYDPNV